MQGKFRQFSNIFIAAFGSLLIIVMALGPAILAPKTALAAGPGLNLTTSPVPIDLAGKPGTTLSTDLRIENNNNQAEQLKVSLMKFSAYGTTGQPRLLERGPGDNYFDWVSFSPSRFTAQPGVWMTVKMDIKLPKSAALGYYYAVIFSRADRPAAAPGEHQNLVLGSTAILVLVEAQVPDAKRQANLVSFSSSRKTYEFLPADFNVNLHNSGNIHLVPHGDIFIMKGSKQIADLVVNPGGGNILPDTNRIFSAQWNDGWPVYKQKVQDGQVVLDGQSRPLKSLDWDFSRIQKLRFGHYTARLVMAYDNGHTDVPIEASLSFWVVPWRLLGVVILILLLILLGLYTFGRGVWKRLGKKRQPKES